MSQIKERQEVGYTGAKPCFHDPEEKATAHHARPIVRTRLRRSDDAPADDNECQPHVRWYDLPHQYLEFENDIGDVEDVEEPLVIVTDQVKIPGHAGDPRVTNVRAVEEGKDIEGRDQRDNPEVHLSYNAPFNLWNDMVAVRLSALIELSALRFDVKWCDGFFGFHRISSRGRRHFHESAEYAH